MELMNCRNCKKLFNYIDVFLLSLHAEYFYEKLI